MDIEYAKKLSDFIHHKAKIDTSDTEIIISKDIESKDILRKIKDGYKFIEEFRGNEEVRWSCQDKKRAESRFAISIKFTYDFDKAPRNIPELRNLHVKDEEKAKEIFKQKLDTSLYSVNNPHKGRLNLDRNSDGTYNMYYYGFNGEKNVYKGDYDIATKKSVPYHVAPSCFNVFYNKVMYMKECLYIRQEYEDFFGKDERPKEIKFDQMMGLQ